jgi:REP-associated tyrosine transposase
MAHPYTPYCPTFSYLGRYAYLLTFVTYGRSPVFQDPAAVAIVLSQILRATHEKHFEDIVHCFMPDHVHLVVEGLEDGSDLKAFAAAAKQYSGYNYAQARRAKLWQKGKNDRIIRDAVDLRDRVRYVVNNPVAAGLVTRPQDFPFLGSQRWTIDELIEWCRPRIGRGSSSDDGC